MIEREESMVERVAAALHQTYARQESDWRVFARAAIEAMKDAPLDVLGAMFEAMFEDKLDCTQAPMIGAGWDAGIDAALKEGS